MVKKLIACHLTWLLISCFTTVNANVEPDLKIVVNNTQVEMGKYFSVRIEFFGDHVPEISNLQQWSDDFFVDRLEQMAEELPESQFLYTEKLRLYPRRTGDKVLHAIALGGAIARPVRIKVLPAIRKGIDGTPYWQALPETIWQGQTLLIGIKQNLLHPANQVVMENASFSGFYVEELNAKKSLEKGINTVQLRWLITAQKSGSMTLEAPMLEQRGRGRWRFYLPRVRLNVKPLPGYIPPTVPVGKLTIGTELIEVDNKAFWRVELKNQGQLPEEVHGIRMQLAKLSGWPVERVQHTSHRPEQHEPMQFAQSYSVPVPKWSLGFFGGPEISVSYFDVNDGQIKTVSGRLPGVWAIPGIGRYVILFVFGVMLFIIMNIINNAINNIRAWRNYRLALKQSKDPHELRRLLLKQDECLTLDDWSHSEPGSNSRQLARQLNALCFAPAFSGTGHGSFYDIKQALLEFYSYRRWLTMTKSRGITFSISQSN